MRNEEENLYCPVCRSLALTRADGTIVPHWTGGDDDHKCAANNRLLSDYIGSPENSDEEGHLNDIPGNELMQADEDSWAVQADFEPAEDGPEEEELEAGA